MSCETLRRPSMSKRTVRNKKGNADHQEIQRTRENSVNFTKLAADLAEIGKRFYSRGWVWGTSGNFSAVTSWDPLRLAISSTGLGRLPIYILYPQDGKGRKDFLKDFCDQNQIP
jgi:hypothetical protein